MDETRMYKSTIHSRRTLHFIDSPTKTVKMKSFIVALCLVACAFAASPEADAETVRSSYDQTPEGNFQSSYETNNGISSQVTGELKVFNKDEAGVVQTGSYRYTAPGGEVIETQYVADENGYRAVGAHLPTPPAPEAIPDYILRSLEYIRTHPQQEVTKKF